MTTIPPSSEAVVKMATRSTGTFVVEASREPTVRSSLLVARGIAGIRPNMPFHVAVVNLTKKYVTVPKHTRVRNMTERPTVIVNMLNDTKTN